MRIVKESLEKFFGILSIALLAKMGFRLGLVAPLTHLLDYYEKLMHILFGWSEPYLTALLRWTNWDLTIHAQWKHVLIILWLYFGVVTKVTLSSFKSLRERLLIGALTLCGVVISLSASIAAGTVVLTDGQSNASMLVFPLLGFALYQLALAVWLATLGRQETWWNRFRAAARLYIGPSTVVIIMLALLLALFADRLPRLESVPNFGLALLFVLFILLAFRWLWTGVDGAVRWNKPENRSWWEEFRNFRWWQSWRVMGNTRIGLAMLTAIGGAAAFLLVGAGLE
jgi:hypothetical protein